MAGKQVLPVPLALEIVPVEEDEVVPMPLEVVPPAVEEEEEEEMMPVPLEVVPPAVEKNGKKPKPEWVNVLVRTGFWEPCMEHVNENRPEECMFCIDCYSVTCPRCKHDEDEPGHRLLKIRRYVYRSTVLASDMAALGIDVSEVQTFTINSNSVIHLRQMRRSKQFRPQHGTPRCSTCRCWLRYDPHDPCSFCSLVCEGNHDVSEDDFSGDEAELRYRSLQTAPPVTMFEVGSSSQEAANEPQEDGEHGNGAPPAAANNNVPVLPEPAEPPSPAANQGRVGRRSFRRRSRKQAAPQRSPLS